MFDWETYLQGIIAVFVITDPIGRPVFFAMLTQGMSREDRRKAALKVIRAVAIILVGAALIGKWFLAGAMIDGLSDEDLAVFDDQWTRIGVSQRWFAEGIFLTSTRYLAKQMANVSSPAYLYHMTYVQTNLRGEVPGACHGCELPFMFGTVREHPEYQRPKQHADNVLTEEVRKVDQIDLESEPFDRRNFRWSTRR